MKYQEKILSREELARAVSGQKAKGKTIVHCHGCFDILHPGHIRHLAWSKKRGDCLVVTVSADSVLKKGLGRPFVPEKLRAENLAAIEFVDFVSIDNEEWAGPVLELIKPDIYVKGKEFENVFTGNFGLERKLVQSLGGKILFSSGDVVYSSTNIYENEKDSLGLPDERLRAFRNRNKIQLKQIQHFLTKTSSPEILVVGDLLVQENIYCLPSGGDPDKVILNVKVVRKEREITGAADVVRTLVQLGAKAKLITLIGDDEIGRWVQQSMKEEGLSVEFEIDSTRETPFQTCYLSKDRELFLANEFKMPSIESATEEKLLNKISKLFQRAKACIVVDYGLGTAGPNVLAEMRIQSQAQDMIFLGITRSMTGMTNVELLSGLMIAVTNETGLRKTFCDTASGVADLAALAVKRFKNQHFLVCLPDNGILLCSPKTTPPVSGKREYRDLKSETYIEYLPSFGISQVQEFDPKHLLGPIAFYMATGASFMLAAYISCAVFGVLQGNKKPGQNLHKKILKFVFTNSFLPDERAEIINRSSKLSSVFV